MFRRNHYEKRRPNILFGIFRFFLSLLMFAVLLGGLYAAYKQFSGVDPLKIDPVAVFKNLVAARTPGQFRDALSSLKIDPKILGKIVQSKNQQNIPVTEESVEGTDTSIPISGEPVFRFLAVADSHNDNAGLGKAVSQAKQIFPDLKFIIGLGDYTQVGTIAELRKAKLVLDSAGLRYFLIPGDHDLWDCRNRGVVAISCFNEVFGPNYQTFTFEGYKFLLLDNSDDYKGLDEAQKKWVENGLEQVKLNPVKGIIVFIHEPLFHPSSDHVMGKIEKSLKVQARDLMFQLKDAGVKYVFSGDTHFFSQYNEPVTGLPMSTIGAVALERNPQVPRFAVVSVLEDGSIRVEDIEIK